MIYIQHTTEGIIERVNAISHIGDKPFSESPADIFENPNKYRVNSDVIQNSLEIPENPAFVYTMQTVCPIDASLTRKIYWVGEKHQALVSPKVFRMDLLIVHFNLQGERVWDHDKQNYLQVDEMTIIDDPDNEGEQITDYYYWMRVLHLMDFPHIIMMGIMQGEITLNNRIYATT